MLPKRSLRQIPQNMTPNPQSGIHCWRQGTCSLSNTLRGPPEPGVSEVIGSNYQVGVRFRVSPVMQVFEGSVWQPNHRSCVTHCQTLLLRSPTLSDPRSFSLRRSSRSCSTYSSNVLPWVFIVECVYRKCVQCSVHWDFFYFSRRALFIIQWSS